MLKLFLAVCTLQVLLSLTEGAVYLRETVEDQGGYITVCRQAPIDLGIVLDSSSSIKHRDFQTAITFLQQFLSHFDIGSDAESVRVAIITYGKGIYIEDSFNLGTYSTKDEVIQAIGRIPHRAGPYTDTGKAIQYMHDVQLAPSQTRSYAEKIVIVVTDGNSQNWKLTKSSAEDTRADGVTVFAIGVGTEVRDTELLNIAGNISMVTKVDSYEQLSTIQQTLASKTCIQKEKPTTTPPPKIQTCGELNPTDVNFVFSPASLGLDGTSWATSFITNTITAKDLDVGFRYGVISGSCPDDEGFDLDEYSTIQEYRERLSAYDEDRITNLVERLVDDGFSAQRGGRPNASKVAVLVASGYASDLKDLEEHVRELTESGVRVFIADPSGSGLTVGNATPLVGRSSVAQSLDLINKICPQKQ
jgi:uncharacterized protein YegL